VGVCVGVLTAGDFEEFIPRNCCTKFKDGDVRNEVSVGTGVGAVTKTDVEVEDGDELRRDIGKKVLGTGFGTCADVGVGGGMDVGVGVDVDVSVRDDGYVDDCNSRVLLSGSECDIS
jgi:hypothetical protein